MSASNPGAKQEHPAWERRRTGSNYLEFNHFNGDDIHVHPPADLSGHAFVRTCGCRPYVDDFRVGPAIVVHRAFDCRDYDERDEFGDRLLPAETVQ